MVGLFGMLQNSNFFVMNKFLDIIILCVCCILVRAYSLFRLVLNCDVMSTDIEELTWQHKDTNFIFDWEKIVFNCRKWIKYCF